MELFRPPIPFSKIKGGSGLPLHLRFEGEPMSSSPL